MSTLKTPTPYPNIFLEELPGTAWKTFIVLRGDLRVGLISKPTAQRGFYQGWKAWELGWNDRTVAGTCKTYFGKHAKRDAILHASKGKL